MMMYNEVTRFGQYAEKILLGKENVLKAFLSYSSKLQ